MAEYGKRALALLVCLALSGCGAAVTLPSEAPLPAAAPWITEPTALAAATPSPTQTATPEKAVSDLAGATAALDALCAQQPGSFSVFLRDLTTGESYAYGADTLYYGASTLKVPFALWLCAQADAGKIDLDSEVDNVFYGQTALYAGTALAQYANTATVPARAAMQAMLDDSDNNATTLLAAAWPATADTGFVEFVEELGFSAPDTCYVTEWDGLMGDISVTDLAAAMQALYDYTEGDAANAKFLRVCFGQTEYEGLYLPTGYRAISKYGSWDAAFHDAAIVFGPHPYLLCCMTDQGDTDIDFPPAPVAAMQELGKTVWWYLDG